MKIPRTSVILAVVIAAVMLADICRAEMRLEISVFPVVDIYSGKLGPERTITTDDDLEQAVLQIFNAIKPKSAPLPSISFQMRPTTFEQLTQWLCNHDLAAKYYEMLGYGSGKMDQAELLCHIFCFPPLLQDFLGLPQESYLPVQHSYNA